MSGVHINLIVGNHDYSQDEVKNELVEARQQLNRKLVDRPEDSLEIKVELPETLEEHIKKAKVNETARSEKRRT